jgi:hypothetical protein
MIEVAQFNNMLSLIVFGDQKAVKFDVPMNYFIWLEVINRIEDLEHQRLFLLFGVFSWDSLLFQIMDKWILTQLNFVDYKLISISVLEEPRIIEFRYVRSWANPHNSNLSYCIWFIVTQRQLQSRFSIFFDVLNPEHYWARSDSK